MPEITVLYAGLLGVMSLLISFKAGSLRGKLGVSIGDGGHQELLLAMRRHGNFVEYVPLTLLIIALLEMNGGPPLAIHLLAGGLILFRFAHAVGLKADTMAGAGRFIGAAGTALVLLVASLWSVVVFF